MSGTLSWRAGALAEDFINLMKVPARQLFDSNNRYIDNGMYITIYQRIKIITVAVIVLYS